MKRKGELLLFLTACIWGLSFVVQKLGMEHIGPFTFSAARLLLGGLVLIPVILFFEKRSKETYSLEGKALVKSGMLLGIFIAGGILFQQVGIQYTTAGKSAFITALYIVFVPALGIFIKKRTGILTWVSVIIAVIGLYLLSIRGDFTMGKGDFLTVFSSMFWGIHILLIGKFAKDANGLKLSCIQFLTAGVIASILAIIFEEIQVINLLKSYQALLFSSVIVVGLAYTLQIFGQKSVEDSVAAIILSLESVTALIAGMIFLGERMTLREIIGAILMFIAILISQRKPVKEEAVVAQSLEE